jgi:AraC-like DNA-binding protein
MKNIQTLFEIAKDGIAFKGETKNIVGDAMEKLESESEFGQLLSILDILNKLGASSEYTVLNAEGFSFKTDIEDNDRINIVFNYVRNRFKDDLALTEIADTVGMTVPSFCRYFKKITNKTFIQFVNEYRLVHASKLLAEKPMSITDICFESGFNNFSHFNKSFKSFTGQNPSEYRNSLKKVVK